MKIDAVAVASSNLEKTVAFYALLGFEFSDLEDGQQHLEPSRAPGSARLMIDSVELLTEINGEPPKPGNLSVFAILYDSPAELDAVYAKVSESGFSVLKEPWDAFWGQRYAIVADPDGYKVDLFAALDKS